MGCCTRGTLGTHRTGYWIGLEAGLNDTENITTSIRSSHLPARSGSLYRLSYPDSHFSFIYMFQNNVMLRTFAVHHYRDLSGHVVMQYCMLFNSAVSCRDCIASVIGG